METDNDFDLRVTAHSERGGREYMEDQFVVAYQPKRNAPGLVFSFVGVFDGHGGKEAALYAKQHLMNEIINQDNFWSDDDELVLQAIRNGFLSTHHGMWNDQVNWPKTGGGFPSTAGTTASVAFIMRNKVYTGHVGDSGIVLGHEDPETGYWRARPLTKDHKPEDPDELRRIIEAGGKVANKEGIPRVVWSRLSNRHKGPIRRSTQILEIPFLAVARSLGDLWSYNQETNEFIVSPEPDVSVVEIDVNTDRCLIFGTDGIWNMATAQDAVNSVYFSETNNSQLPRPVVGSAPDPSSQWLNPSKRLLRQVHDRWRLNKLCADNMCLITVMLDPVEGLRDPVPVPVEISRQAAPQQETMPIPEEDEVTPPRGVDQPSTSTAHPSAQIPGVDQPRVMLTRITTDQLVSHTKGKVLQRVFTGRVTKKDEAAATSSRNVVDEHPPVHFTRSTTRCLRKK